MNNGYQNSKSAVAFFFLFFLHGISMETVSKAFHITVGGCRQVGFHKT
jgi:hypothetical protein